MSPTKLFGAAASGEIPSVATNARVTIAGKSIGVTEDNLEKMGNFFGKWASEGIANVMAAAPEMLRGLMTRMFPGGKPENEIPNEAKEGTIRPTGTREPIIPGAVV